MIKFNIGDTVIIKKPKYKKRISKIWRNALVAMEEFPHLFDRKLFIVQSENYACSVSYRFDFYNHCLSCPHRSICDELESRYNIDYFLLCEIEINKKYLVHTKTVLIEKIKQ